METKKTSAQARPSGSLPFCVILVAAACLVHGVMQGVHDNYGIMLTGLLETSGLGYSALSLCIGVEGAGLRDCSALSRDAGIEAL